METLRTQRGFTLLEVLLVVALIGILAGIVILAINPSKQISDTNNAQRSVDVNTILNGVYQYAIDNSGSLPSGIDGTPTEICQTGATCVGLSDLSDITASSTYLVSIPIDPLATTTDGTGYTIATTTDNRVTVAAPFAENGQTISVTR